MLIKKNVKPVLNKGAITLFFIAVLLLAIYRAASLSFAIESVDFDGFSMTTFVDDFTLPAWVEWLRRTAILLVVMLSGFILYSLKYFPPGVLKFFLAPFAIMLGWRACITAVQLADPGWQANYLLEQNGILAIGCSIFMLIGFDESLWSELSKLYRFLALPLSIIVILHWVGWEGGNRAEGIKVFRGYVYLLSVIALFSLSNIRRGALGKYLLGSLPIMALLLLGIATATRAVFVYVFVMLFVLFVCRWHALKSVEKTLVIIVSATAILLVSISFSDLIGGSGAFGDRIGEDTRSEQLIKFFKKVELYELALGTPDAGHDGRFKDDLNRWGIDSGIITLLYVGGLPLLFVYSYLHFYPALRLLKSRLDLEGAVVVATVVSSSVQMISSEMPSVTEGYLALLPLVGRCFYLLLKNRRKLSVREIR